MGRYLMYISYVGRGFRGLQKQRGLPDGHQTIVGAIEEGLKGLKPANEVDVYTSSRTDKGVNALCNTVHVDLQSSQEDKQFCPRDVTSMVNANMTLQKHAIRVLHTRRVPDDFNCRFQAKSRTYVYRSAICRRPQSGYSLPYPPFEYMTAALRHQDPVDVELLHRSAKLLSGTHDFSAFSKERMLREQHWVNPVKTMEVSVQEGRAFMHHYLPAVCHDGVMYLEFVFKAGSFLFRQVRKMASVMLAVGAGQVELDVITRMLDQPQEQHITKTDIFNIPSSGLYLTNVEYDPADLIYQPPDGSTSHILQPPDGSTSHILQPPDGSTSHILQPPDGSTSHILQPPDGSTSSTTRTATSSTHHTDYKHTAWSR